MDALLDRRALDAKVKLRGETTKVTFGSLAPGVGRMPEPEKITSFYDSYETGRFEHLTSIRLRWKEPDWFEFIPKQGAEFAFTGPKSNPTTIAPRRMFTDGGSIPRAFWWLRNLSPWGYAPAFLVHDFEFDLHHCGESVRTFKQVNDTMMQGVKTLMVDGLCPTDQLTFWMIDVAINSSAAKAIWDAKSDGCTLPPDVDEP